MASPRPPQLPITQHYAETISNQRLHMLQGSFTRESVKCSDLATAHVFSLLNRRWSMEADASSKLYSQHVDIQLNQSQASELQYLTAAWSCTPLEGKTSYLWHEAASARAHAQRLAGSSYQDVFEITQAQPRWDLLVWWLSTTPPFCMTEVLLSLPINVLHHNSKY